MQTAVSVSGQSQNPRGAGILLHITSLPSRFGVGDLGTSAYQFADYLERGKQKYWQILPLNPTGKEQLYSPYSSTSGMAGNPLLISPEKLVEDGFLRSGDLAEFPAMGNQKADYAYAERTKSRLLEKAYRNFMRSGPGVTAFEEFIEVEKSWLDDFSVFMVLKKLNRGKAWIEWPADVKNRKKIAMQHIRKE